MDCPAEFQQRVTDRFGLNPFGEPNFRIAWGKTEKTLVAGRNGYEERLLCGLPCWLILRWVPPESYGSPDLWYRQNKDEDTGLCLLGPYPSRGKYEIAVPLYRKRVVNGTLEFEAMPLNHSIIDTMIPLMLKAQELTFWERKAALEQQEQEENDAMVNEIADRLQNDMPTFYGPTSYPVQANCTALIDRKMAEVERVWRSLPANILRNPKRGFQQGH
jgi:hypothetical protein